MNNSVESPTWLGKLINHIESARSSDKLLLRLAFFAVIASGIWLALSANNQYSEVTATTGGSITEGIVGTPRFVNPVLATTRADQDITALVYSGLLTLGTDGLLTNDVAQSIDLSEDGLTYSITLREDVTFHDGESLQADDVLYTIGLIQDPDLKSPLRGNWIDVVAEQTGDYSFTITLDEAYAPFTENLTFGIMPAHAWSTLPIEQLPFSQLNTEPIGSGPFQITSALRDTSGLIEQYRLTAFINHNSQPKISELEIIFYQNEELVKAAIDNQDIDSTAYLAPIHIAQIDDEYRLIQTPLPRIFGIFFNQSRNPALRDQSAREALTMAIDREKMIQDALYGYGRPLYRPTAINPTTLSAASSSEDTDRIANAIAILESGDWVKNEQNIWEKTINKEKVPLSLTLRTSNVELFSILADDVVDAWQAIGVEIAVEQFEQTGLVQSVIRPRDFEALLFGLDMSRSYDMYPFWHSSQQDDPGLNIAQYTNVNVDELLESARVEQSREERLVALNEAGTIISQEKPAVFLFQPTLTYLVADDITMPTIRNIGDAADRFSTISDWHTESESLWTWFRE